MIKIIKKIPLPSCKCNNFTSAIYSGCSYKFLVPSENKVEFYTGKLSKVTSKKVCDKYKLISYAKNSNEFYIVKEDDYNSIYLVDDKFNEINKFDIKANSKYLKKINSISFDKETCKIYICTKYMVYSITMDGDFIKEELSKSAIRSFLSKEKVYINRCNHQSVATINLLSAAFICDKLLVAYEKDSSAFISEISSNGNVVDSKFIEDNIAIKTMFLVNGEINFLVQKQDKYDYIYITNFNCKEMSPKKCLLEQCCNSKPICEKKNKCKKQIPCECEEVCTNSVVQSIALIECAIAEILCSEAEKIKKATKITCNICDLIKVNDSVSTTIKNVTFLEQILTDKLSIAVKHPCNKKC